MRSTIPNTDLLLLCDEMRLQRLKGCKEAAFALAREVLALAEALGCTGKSAAAVCIDCAAVCQTFGQPEKALVFLERAQTVLQGCADAEEEKAGLFSNKGLALMALDRFDEAEEAFVKALSQAQKCECTCLRQACIWLNMAALAQQRTSLSYAEEEIIDAVVRAQELLEKEGAGSEPLAESLLPLCLDTIAYYRDLLWF